MESGDQRRYFRRRRLRARCACGSRRGSCCNGCWRRCHRLLRTHGVPRLCRGSLGRTGAQLLARSLARPRTGIDFAHHSQPFLGLRLAGEESHVETEALAPLLETAADEEGEAFELGQIGLRERHGRRRGTQIEHERACLCGRRRRMVRVRLSRRQICRWCHRFPGQSVDHRRTGTARTSRGMLSAAWVRDRGSPAVIGTVL